MKQFLKRAAAVVVLLTMLACIFSAIADTAASAGQRSGESMLWAGRRKTTPTPKPTKTPRPDRTPEPETTPAPTEASRPAAPTLTPVPDGPIIEPQAIADWLFSHEFTLPDNFITKKEAQQLGWGTRYRYVSDAAPGMSIGGDHFGNYEGKLPTAKGRRYYECDCFYTSGSRNAYRIIFSNDGLVFYTEDHYETFVQMYPSDANPSQAP